MCITIIIAFRIIIAILCVCILLDTHLHMHRQTESERDRQTDRQADTGSLPDSMGAVERVCCCPALVCCPRLVVHGSYRQRQEHHNTMSVTAHGLLQSPSRAAHHLLQSPVQQPMPVFGCRKIWSVVQWRALQFTHIHKNDQSL